MHVYVITNMANGKLYVGQHSTEDLDWYFRETVASAMRGSTGKRLLYRAIRKHKPESFNIRSIHRCENKEEMDRAERAYIKLFGTRDPDLGYNLTDGGDGVLGLVFSDETIEKMRLRGLAEGISEKCRAGQKEYLKTRVFSEETRNKLSEAHRGKVVSEETRKKQAIKASSRTNVERLRALNTGRKQTPKHIEKRRQTRIGYKHSEETKAKMRLAYQKRMEATKCQS